ncbi:MAG: hypothetical protein K1X88_35735 [Nannocystaceae bacterium]|nr:hypothetical protein [Nannocystaceae bacterium]
MGQVGQSGVGIQHRRIDRAEILGHRLAEREDPGGPGGTKDATPVLAIPLPNACAVP